MSNRKKYVKFLEKNFVLFKKMSYDEEELEKIYKNIEKIQLIILKTERNYKNLDYEFLKISMTHFIALLLEIPNNFPPTINFCVRGVIENILRFIYFNRQISNEKEKILKIGYRNLKDELKKNLRKDFQEDILNNFSVLYDLYSKYSNEVHIKTSKSLKISENIEELFQKNHKDHKEMEKDVYTILKIIIVLFSELFDISLHYFSLEDKIFLPKEFNSGKYKRLLEIIEEKNHSY